jgi:hypothetical protein
MPIVEGKAPTPVDPDARKYLLDKLSDTRKSCEWLVALGAANVFANLLQATSMPRLRKATLVIIAVQMFLALIGATAVLSSEVDPADAERRLKRTLVWRYRIRNIALLLLVSAFVMLLPQIWAGLPSKK